MSEPQRYSLTPEVQRVIERLAEAKNRDFTNEEDGYTCEEQAWCAGTVVRKKLKSPIFLEN